MKEAKKIIEELIDVQIGYYNDRKEIKRYLEDQPVVLAMLESYTERIEDITKVIVKSILEISDEPSDDKYNKENWHRRVASNIIGYVIGNNGEYKDSAIEILLNLESLSDYTDKLEGNKWFYNEELLEEYSKGFPTYQKKLEEEKEKKKSKKTTA